MNYHADDTIAAIASSMQGGARGIVRISGPLAMECLLPLFHAAEPVSLQHLTAARRIPGDLEMPGELSRVPCELFVWPDPRSYTRQPSIEIHTYGARPVLDAILHAVLDQNARLAEPGEFTLRAFLAGRIDLTQAEAVLGVIEARDQAELKQALTQLAGGLGRKFHQIRDRLLNLLADVEASLDFTDEDLVFRQPEEVLRELDTAEQDLRTLGKTVVERGTGDDLPRVVLFGSANVGKSSLFNLLTNWRHAIVADESGTTRDWLSEVVDFAIPAASGKAWKIRLIDTAGWSAMGGIDEIGEAAQGAMLREVERADLRLLCLDRSRPLNPWEISTLESTDEARNLVGTKADLPPGRAEVAGEIPVSADTSEGIQRLRSAIVEHLARSRERNPPSVASTAARCGESLQATLRSISTARTLVQSRGSEELLAAELRQALDGLGRIVGAVYTDDILDRVFSRFCIGK